MLRKMEPGARDGEEAAAALMAQVSSPAPKPVTDTQRVSQFSGRHRYGTSAQERLHWEKRKTPQRTGCRFPKLRAGHRGIAPSRNRRAVEITSKGSPWRIMESLRLEKASKIKSNPSPPRLINHVPKCRICPFFEPLQGWGLHHCPGQPGPTPEQVGKRQRRSRPSAASLSALSPCLQKWNRNHYITPRGYSRVKQST